MITGLIFAGGVGRRMKSEAIPKQFIKIEGISIITRTIMHFEKHDKVDNLVVVCLEAWIKHLEDELKTHNICKVTNVIPGGATGFQSIHKGLLKIQEYMRDDDIVLICDGVRPILSKELISDCINAARLNNSAVPVTKSIDSVLYSEDGSYCEQNFEREKIYITQAPQGYKYGYIMDAHRKAIQAGKEAVSSADLLLELGEKVHVFQGLRENIKVTTPEDLETIRASQYYRRFKDFAEEVLISEAE